jgi:hypothetical protein
MAGSLNAGYTNLRQVILTGGGGGGGNLSGSKELTKNTYLCRIVNGQQPSGYDLRFSHTGFTYNTGNTTRKIKGVEIFLHDLKIDPQYLNQNPNSNININDVVVWLNFYSLQLFPSPNASFTEWNAPSYLKNKDTILVDDARIFGGIKASIQYHDFITADGNSRFLPNLSVFAQIIMTYYFEV